MMKNCEFVGINILSEFAEFLESKNMRNLGNYEIKMNLTKFPSRNIDYEITICALNDIAELVLDDFYIFHNK